MDTQYLIYSASVAVLLILAFFVRGYVVKSKRLREATELRAEHEEQIRKMTRRMSETGTDLLALEQEADSEQEFDEFADQSIEAQYQELNEFVKQ